MSEEARRNKTSLSALVNHVLYDRFIVRHPTVSPNSVVVWKPMLAELLSLVSAEDARRMGWDLGGELLTSLIIERYGRITVDSIADTFRESVERDGIGDFSEIRESNRRIIGIVHQLGKNGSILQAACSEALFEKIGLHPKISSTKDAVVIEL